MDNRCSLWVHERNKVASDRDGCPCRGSSTTEADRVHSISEKEHSRGWICCNPRSRGSRGPAPLPQLAATAVDADSSVNCRTYGGGGYTVSNFVFFFFQFWTILIW
jgi:hypothetical protein